MPRIVPRQPAAMGCWERRDAAPTLAGRRHGEGCSTRPQRSCSLPSVQGKDLKASLIINHFALFSLST